MNDSQEKCLHGRLITEDCPTCWANKKLWQSGWERGAASRDQELADLHQQLTAMTLDRDEWKEAHDVVVSNCKLSDEQHHRDMEGYAAALAATETK